MMESPVVTPVQDESSITTLFQSGAIKKGSSSERFVHCKLKGQNLMIHCTGPRDMIDKIYVKLHKTLYCILNMEALRSCGFRKDLMYFQIKAYGR